MLAGFTYIGYRREGEYLGVFERPDGMAFEVRVPEQVDWSMPRERMFVDIYHHITEQGQTLYGFPCLEDRQLFIDLISVDGIGPALALKIMSFYSPEKIRIDIADGSSEDLCKARGVGKKTAEKIILALKDKYKGYGTANLPERTPNTTAQDSEDLRNIKEAAAKALIKLGWRPSEAKEKIDKVAKNYFSTKPKEENLTMDEIASRFVGLSLKG